jgi:molybdate transport system ATP-binding protein
MGDVAPEATKALLVVVGQEGPIPLDAELCCAPGELLALVGPSGSGKSTILRTISGLYHPSEGHVACNGEIWLDTATRIDVPPHRRSVGLVFQSYALFPHMTVLGNVMAALGHRPQTERRRRALALIEMVHLAGLERRRPTELSGGQQQRVAVARALARDPRVLLLDEPFSAVDKVTRQRLYRELAELRRTLNMPIVLVTHDFDEAARLADRMCLLHHGRLLQSGTPREVLAHPVSVEAARLVDLKNMFEATVFAHRPSENATVIQWGGHQLVTPHRLDLAPGGAVAWAIPSTQVILHRSDLPSAAPVNLVNGIVGELTMLSESTSVAVFVDGRSDQALSMTVPEHYARRTRLAVGTEVTVSLLPDGIHLMPLTGGDPSKSEKP